jgi:hypothetical protein
VSKFSKNDWAMLTANAVCVIAGNWCDFHRIVVTLNAFACGVLVWQLAVVVSRNHERQAVAKQTLYGLRAFRDRLKSGDAIYVTKVMRHETPDGPMHTFEPQEFSIADLHDTDL